MKKLTIVITRCKEDLATLSRLLDSIAHQTFKDIEVILSDDGFEAPNIEQIRDKYAFPIFNVHFDKKTVSHARNIGFQLSSSKYVMFCDCDDMFYDSNPTGLEDAIKKMDEGGIQVLRSVIMYEYPSKAKDDKLHAVAQLDCDDELKLVKAAQINGSSIHGKIFDLAFVKRIGAKFCDELSINEEAPFVNFTYQVAEKKYDIWQPFYVWKYNANSVTRNIGKLYPIKGLDQYLKAARIWQKKVIAYDKFYGTSKFECRKVAGTLIHAFYWLEVESSKFKDIDSFKQYYDLDIEAAADFYADFSMHITNNDIWQLSGNNRNYAAVSAWLNKLHDIKSRT